MKITADTNLLIRAVVRDEAKQGETAAKILREAELVAVPLTALCEFVWVLKSVYHFPATDIAHAVRTLLNVANVATDRPSAELGLMVLESGGDFADGIIAAEGYSLGGEVFVTFDRKASQRIAGLSLPTHLL